MKLPRLVILSSLLSLVACTPNLSGQLISTDGQLSVSRDAKVNVTRLDVDSADAATVQPNVFIGDVGADGKFSVTLDVAEGEYLVEAVVPGYAVVSQRVNMADGQPITLQMIPVGNPKAGMIGTNMDADAGVGSGGATLTPPSL